MKKFINIILTLGLIAFTASCVKEYGPHEPGEPDNANCYGVYFPVQEGTGAHTYDPTQPTEADIIVARQHANGAITVPVEIVDEKGVFNVEPITFADGQSETVLHLTFPNAEIGVEYPLSVTITDPDYASKYNSGAISFDFSVFRVEWKYFLNPETGEPANFTFTEDWNGTTHTARVKYYEVDGVRTCVTESDPFVEGGEEYPGFWGSGAEYELNFKWYPNAKTLGADGETAYPAVYIPAQAIDFHPSYGANVEVIDYYTYWTDINPQAALAGMSFAEFANKYGSSYPCSYYDNNGGFHFYVYRYYMRGIGGWSSEVYTDMLADGFVRTDYSLKVETDYSTEGGKAPVYFTAGVDTKEIKYIVVDGEVTATQAGKYAESIADGTAKGVASVTEFEYNEEDNVNEAALELSFDETGFYSVVAVTYDEAGEAQESAYASVFVAAADDPSYDVVIDAALEEVPSRFKDLKKTNALGFYIAGKDLKEVYFGVYKSETVKKSGLDATVEKVRAGKPVGESELAAINGVGGYASAVTGLDANTEYTLVVWATNGSKATVVTSAFATDGLPNEVIAEGNYVANIFWEGDEIPTTLEYNPNTEKYEIPNFVDGETTLSFSVVENDSLIKLGAAPQYTGHYYSDESDGIYVMEAAETENEDFLEYFGLTAEDHSYYNAESGVYYFCVAYVTEERLLMAGWEAFVPDEAEDAAASLASASVSKSFKATKSGKAHAAEFSYQRDPKAVSFAAKAIAPRKTNASKSISKSMARPENDSNAILF